MTYLAGELVLAVSAGAPNNSQDAEGRGNYTPVKAMRIGSRSYPYVAAQAYRRWLRDTLADSWRMSPVERSGSGAKQQAYTSGDPIEYPDDDLFGYMRAIKGAETQRDTVFQLGTLRAVAPAWIARDYGTMTRGFSAEERPLLHEHEFYAADLSAPWLVDLAHLGVFTLGGEGRRTNLTVNQTDHALAAGKAEETTFRGMDAIALPIETRRQRAAILLRGLATVHGGASRALHYEDRTPAFVLVAPMRGGVNPFRYVVSAGPGSTTVIDPDVIRSEAEAWRDELDGTVRVGWKPGWPEAGAEQRDKFAAAVRDLGVVVDHPRTVLTTLASEIERGAHDDWFSEPVAMTHA